MVFFISGLAQEDLALAQRSTNGYLTQVRRAASNYSWFILRVFDLMLKRTGDFYRI